MRVLSVGGLSGYGESNTCLHRHNSLKKIADYIDSVDSSKNPVNLLYKIANFLFEIGLPVLLPDLSNINNQIRGLINKKDYDILWIDKGQMVNAKTLRYVRKKQPKCRIVIFSPDNMALRHNQSQNFLNSVPYYHVTFTTKSFIIEDLKRLGAKNVFFVPKTYHADFHFPRQLSQDDYARLGGDVGFIGMWEKERCESILYLATNGIKVRVFGEGEWLKYKNYPNITVDGKVFSDDYPKALKAFKISLCFLRKENKDQQTARTMEIPACGGFMLAERTNEHRELFVEGEEAEFFETNEELLKKCQYYLNHDEDRLKIVNAGTLRCQTSGYSNDLAIKKMVNIVLKEIAD